MNGEELYALLQDLPDDFITETVVPYRKRRISLRVIIPAIAACLAVVIAAAVYPKIRMQKPDITADPAIITETAALSTMSTAIQQTTGSASVTQTAADSKTTAKTTSAAVTTNQPEQETAAEAVTTPAAAQTAMSEPQTTAGTQNTGNTAVTRIAAEAEITPATAAQTAMSETQPTADAQSGQEIIEIPDTPASSEDRPESITIPVWSQKPIREEGVPEIMTPPNSAKCSFSVMLQAEALNQQTRELLGSFDFEKNDCLVCHLYTNCAAVTATGAAMQNNTLSVQMNCVDAAKYQPTYEMQILLGIPKSLAVSQAQCRTELTHSTAENPDSPDDNPETITLTIH